MSEKITLQCYENMTNLRRYYTMTDEKFEIIWFQLEEMIYELEEEMKREHKRTV